MIIRSPEEDVKRILYSEEQIKERVKILAKQITEEYKGKRPIIVCILKGASFFYIDLCREIKTQIYMDFISVSSYGNDTKSSGVVKLLKDIKIDLSGRDLIIVDDIIDTGNTLKYLINLFSLRNPKSIKIACLLNKLGVTNDKLTPDYVGFDIENCFVVGYGLDYADYYRNLPFIGELKEECYK